MKRNEQRSGYKKTRIGWVPTDWECVPFTSIFDRVVESLTPAPAETYREIGVRSHGKGIFHKAPVTGENLGEKRVFCCQPGTLVFNIVFAWEQAVAIVSENERGFIASHRFPMYRGRINQASEQFYLLFFKTRRGKCGLNLASPGGAGRNKTLGQKDLEYLFVPKPGILEQRAIAEVLECWDQSIRACEKKIEIKRAIKKGLMQRLLAGKQRLPGFEGEWEREQFGRVFTFLKTYPVSRSELTNRTGKNCGIYNIHYGDLHATFSAFILDFNQEDRVPLLRSERDLPENPAFLKDGDLIVADVSEDFEGVCACVEIANVGNRKVTGGLHTFAARDTAGRTEPGYRGYMLAERTVSRELRRMATGSSVHGVSKTNMGRLAIALPARDEQRSIARILHAAAKEIGCLADKLATLKRQRQFLLTNLVTGTIRLPKFRAAAARAVAGGGGS